MAYYDLWEMLLAALRQIAYELVLLTPKILIALIIFIIAFLLIKIMNILLRKTLEFAKIDSLFKRLIGFEIPFSINRLLIIIADVGVFLISLYAVAGLFVGPQQIHLLTEWIQYGARIISIIVITIFLFSIFSMVTNRIRVETRLRSYSLFIILLLVTAMLVDVTALSEHVKGALITGLAIGVGISVGVFAVWFFFHDYLDKLIAAKTESKKESEEQ